MLLEFANSEQLEVATGMNKVFLKADEPFNVADEEGKGLILSGLFKLSDKKLLEVIEATPKTKKPKSAEVENIEAVTTDKE
jgi:hypothetical protein